MLKAKELLAEQLAPICERICFKKDKLKKTTEFIIEHHGFQPSEAVDLIQMKTPLYELNEFELYCVAEAVTGTHRTGLRLDEYFTSNEINSFSKSRKDSDKVEFPIKIQCIQVSNDQWIGKISVNFLMKLRKSQLINYNTNAQRAMQRMVRGGVESYKISLNKKAVDQIRESMRNGTYISNTITLNMPDTTDYFYNQDKCILTINNIDHFDMADGYHRYIAMSRESDENPSFDYTMELRITNFPDTKTKQFIFQEDQKTKMSKINSASMNMSNDANIILERLNQDVLFNLKGKVSRNNGIVNFADMAFVIEKLFFTPNKKIDVVERMAIEKQIKTGINRLTEEGTELLERKWGFDEIVIALVLVRDYSTIDNMYKTFCETSKKLKENKDLSRVIASKRVTVPNVNEIKSIIERK